MALLLPFRFLAGGFGSVGATLVGGSLADIWATRERGFKMGLFALCAVLGTGELIGIARPDRPWLTGSASSSRACSNGLGRDEPAARMAMDPVDPGHRRRRLPARRADLVARNPIGDPASTQGQGA